MPDVEWLAAQFEQNRPRLAALAHRMLGSRVEAEDAVQETWIRLSRSDADQLENLGGWLTTVVSRICLDRLRARHSRPEEPVGTAPAEEIFATDADDPASQAVLADSVGAALLVVLDLLAPAERVAFVLHDVFAVPFDEIATVVGRSPDAARQLASRARRRVQGATPTGELDVVRQRELVRAFLDAAQSGDFEALVDLLDPEVVLQPDAAALRMGSLRETRGPARVAAALSGGARSARIAIIDGVAGLVWAPGGRTRGVIEFTIRDGKIVALDVIGDATRIRELEISQLDG
jgi:RNA polymerase sigma-70 factor (ECF subfamily)